MGVLKTTVILLMAFLSTSCYSASEKPLTDGGRLNITDRLYESSWYELPWWDHNGYPKYSGAMGTYTAKHIPIAVRGDGKDYYIFSDNSSGNLEIYVGDSEGGRTLVHTTPDVVDPHDNAVINYFDGYVYVVVSARANKRIGYSYRSKYRDDTSEFILLDSGWWAYPQLWQDALLYTDYDESNNRELYSRNSLCDVKLVEGGHYSVSYDDGDWIHLVYTWHEDGELDKRTGVYYIKSDDGCVWRDIDGNQLELPLSQYDISVRLYDTDYLYLKDLTVVGGEINLLAVDSNSFYPDEGERVLKVYTPSSVTSITEVGHNYNTGAFVDGYIVTPTFGEFGYAGGDIEVFSMDGERVLDANFKYNYNYVRKVFNGSGAYVSESLSASEKGEAFVRRIDIESK